MDAIYSATISSSNQFGIAIQATRDGTIIHGLSQDGLLLKDGQTIKLKVVPGENGTAQVTLDFDPHLDLHGAEYADIPIHKGEPAFLGDGGPNPDFNWEEWHAAGQRMRAFMERALDACRNAGRGNEIVAERVIERVEQELICGLGQQP